MKLIGLTDEERTKKIKAQIDYIISEIPAKAKKVMKTLVLLPEYYNILKDGKHLTQKGKYKGFFLRVDDTIPYGTMYITIR